MLKDQYEKTGNWLFRWRSYFPVVFLLMALWSLRYFRPFPSELANGLWELLCLSVSYVGLAIRILTIGYAPTGTSGRNTRGQVAATLNTTGIYSLTRHPLYLGNFLMWFGISLFPMLWWLSALTILLFWVYYERIMFAEEAHLQKQFGESFVRWAQKTPAFIPSFGHYVKPNQPFSWKKVLRKEHNGFFAAALCLFLMETSGNYYSGLQFHFDTMWLVILGLTFTVWVILRILKRWGLTKDIRGAT